MATLVTTVTETLRYRGKIGQWSWVFHRLAGLGTLLFLVIHVVDTSWVYFFPELYEKAISIYQSPLFTLGEFILVAAVVYHAFNGLRIVILDYRPEWWEHQAVAAQIVLLATVVVLVPAFVLMGQHVAEFYGGRPFDLRVNEVIVDVGLPFGGGMIAVLVLGVILSYLFGATTGSAGAAGMQLQQRSRFEQLMWMYMRISGVVLVVLALGHLAFMHVINGVFSINQSGEGLAANFVAARWAFLGWRLYDIGLLILAMVHGFNGFRYVVRDYTPNPTVRRGLNWAIVIGAVITIGMGAVALINGVPAG